MNSMNRWKEKETERTQMAKYIGGGCYNDIPADQTGKSSGSPDSQIIRRD